MTENYNSNTKLRDLPPYYTIDYWNQRYHTNEEEFDWYCSWKKIQTTLGITVDEDTHLLHIGSGTSSLAQDLYEEGVCNVRNIDFSPVCIERMKVRYPHLDYKLYDATELINEFEAESFNYVIDKGCFDTILCSRDYEVQISKLLNGIHKLLKTDGVLIIVSIGPPSLRLLHLRLEDLYTIEVERIKKENIELVIDVSDGESESLVNEQVEIGSLDVKNGRELHLELRYYYVYKCLKRVVK